MVKGITQLMLGRFLMPPNLHFRSALLLPLLVILLSLIMDHFLHNHKLCNKDIHLFILDLASLHTSIPYPVFLPKVPPSLVHQVQ